MLSSQEAIDSTFEVLITNQEVLPLLQIQLPTQLVVHEM